MLRMLRVWRLLKNGTRNRTWPLRLPPGIYAGEANNRIPIKLSAVKQIEAAPKKD